MRWQHPQLGLILPDRFIPMAEQTGAVRPLTLWMLERALQQCLEWRRLGYDLIAAVNLSPRNLHDHELPERVRALLDVLDAPASMLELEITESVIMSDPLRSLQVLTRLSKMGLRLAVDDFGTGYSSFSYLRKLPVHEIKIDKSFIDDMVEDGDEVIVQSTIELAHNLGLTCVAEGVQDQATLERLAKLGCDTAKAISFLHRLTAQASRSWLRQRGSGQGDAALILAIVSGILLALSFPRYGHPDVRVARAHTAHRRGVRRASRPSRVPAASGLSPRASSPGWDISAGRSTGPAPSCRSSAGWPGRSA